MSDDKVDFHCPECGVEGGSTVVYGQPMFSCGERNGCGHLWEPRNEAEQRYLTITDDTLRRHYGPDDDGMYVEAKLTHEGVIVDIFDATDECIGTFAQTWVEFIEGTV